MTYDGRKIANSFYLPKNPFLRGIASLIDFTGELDRDIIEQVLESYDKPRQVDTDALRETWQAVGDCMRWAIKEYDKELKEKIAREQ